VAKTFEEYMELSADELRRQMDAKQIAFVEHLLANKSNATLAAISAGYSEKTAASQASRLLKSPKVAAFRSKRAEEIYAAIGVTAQTLALELEEIKARCMAGKEHLSWNPDSRAWESDGLWMFDAKGAISAIKAQAEIMGVAAPVKVNVETRDKTLEEYLESLPEGRQF
jgi:phage terminase small subunit